MVICYLDFRTRHILKLRLETRGGKTMVITRMRKDSNRSRPAVLQGSSFGVGIHAKLDV